MNAITKATTRPRSDAQRVRLGDPQTT